MLGACAVAGLIAGIVALAFAIGNNPPLSAPWVALFSPGLRVADPKACQCGEVLKGVIKPWEGKVWAEAAAKHTVAVGAIEDVALAVRAYEKAIAQGLGERLPDLSG